MAAVRRHAAGITGSFGSDVVFVDLGNIEWTAIDGAAQLFSPLDIRVI